MTAVVGVWKRHGLTGEHFCREKAYQGLGWQGVGWGAMIERQGQKTVMASVK